MQAIQIGITVGDPLGIGPEIVNKALEKLKNDSEINFHVFGDYQNIQLQKTQLKYSQYNPQSAGQASVHSLQEAMTAYHANKIDALVTAPICKEHVKLAGFEFPGHTEFLADACGVQDRFLMMLASEELKLTLATIHMALSKVSPALNQEKIIRTIEMTHEALIKDFGILHPKIAVCGLNPHAGESGHFGREEIEIIQPAIQICQEKNIDCQGPQVPDAIFKRVIQKEFDAIVCMYHDQGLIPFKLLYGEKGVNTTLGLPLVRTSPDHGTAFDIAGKNLANPSSMIEAILLAKDIVNNRKNWRRNWICKKT